MKAIILAAGRGSRLKEMTEKAPKCQVALGGIPMIERQIATFRQSGITDITLVTGYRGEMLRYDGVKNAINGEWETTNMVVTLFSAAQDFGDDLIVSYGDIVFEKRVLDALIAAPGEISVIVDRQWRPYWEARFEDPLSDAESLRLDEADCIVDIGQQVAAIDDIQGQYIGLMRFRGPGVETLRNVGNSLGKTQREWMNNRPLKQAYMTDLLMEMILCDHAVDAVPVDGGWLEIDTQNDYALAESLFSSRRSFPWFSPEGVAIP
ncbi:MAG: phosphocholine cytidylyltransferase family protein [Rhodospirillaceae bacterium]|nr:phosphocholine cytidylyltransferase family protein [Rhodospirillaceae bacterium]MBT5459370.1 phosphocholine cytidylyltransferase family protein [Rhodospirillaceae bacterium]MBT7760210.1 phosphocholine cytidylyltransferase family protein [Rhodospirillaceae bacterium]